jgi:flagellar motor switch protein FliN
MGDEKDLVSQDEIEKLLWQSGAGSPTQASTPAPDAPATAAEKVPESGPGGSSPQPGQDPQVPPESQLAADFFLQTPQPSQPAQDSDKLLAQEDIERLLSQTGKAPAAPPRQPAVQEKPMPGPLFPGEGQVVQQDVEFLLNQAERALASIGAESKSEPPPGVVAFRLEEFPGAPPSTENATLDLIRDVELDLRIELGRTHMYLEDVLKLRRGSVVPLDKLAGDPVDIFVNGRLIARGEVLVLNDNFCVRVAELIAGKAPAAT